MRAILFCVIFSASSEGLTNSEGQIFSEVTDSCRYYDGENLGFFLREGSGQIQNPLLMSRLGRRLYNQNLQSSYAEYKYLVSDKEIEAMLTSPEFARALNECYGSDEQKKINYAILFKSLEYQGKSSAALVEFWQALGIGNAVFGIASMIIRKYKSLEAFLRWGGRVAISTFAAQLAYLGKQIHDHGEGNPKFIGFEPETRNTNPADLAMSAESQLLVSLLAEKIKALESQKKNHPDQAASYEEKILQLRVQIRILSGPSKP